MVRIFQILAVILTGIAAFFLWKENSDWAFACGVLAACAFFIAMRSQMKARIKERELAESSSNNTLDEDSGD
jgi:cellobiose-specific phosphotransferase system component IIC